ncbi:MAG TPA: stress protein [Oxalobacteraceae bacterium]|nr:stress protein [Oxalobacteraceae bacterium]HCN88639.1 stress protein [Oxalobacteraceae bacterium]
MASNLMRFDPFSEAARLDPFRNFEDIFRDFSMMPTLRGVESPPRIRIDVSETDNDYLVKADIPGVKKEDIKVSIDGNQVSVSAEVKEEKEAGGAGMLRSERYYGQEFRAFTLPQEVDDKKAVAKYENGVLHLTLPKKHGTGGKQLSIQ